ncbi:MAG: metallophosphoesterase [Pseudomonadota bacterium]|nr:metallophosphoesterase [Pseudomonadota bacterium]
MAGPTDKSRKGFLRRFRELVTEFGGCEDVDLEDTIHIESRKIRVPAPVVPLQILLGGEKGKRLFLYPEIRITEDGTMTESGAFLLFDPDQFFSGISGFIRLFPGDSLILGRESAAQNDLLTFPKSVGERHLSLKLPDNGLVLKDRSPEHGTCISPLASDKKVNRLATWRRNKLERLARVLPGPLEPLPREVAGDLLDAVIDIVEREPRQSLDSQGRPGGVVALPHDVSPILVGDLHARIDNLLVVLTQNGFLEALEQGRAALIILGDAVHSDDEGTEDRMDTSMLMMDLIFRLKIKFPDRVYYLRGNHDSFSEDISKGGVPQGLLWEQALHENRGAKYARAMARFYDSLPYVALSRRFIACHAGPPTCKVSRDMLINIRQHPKLEREITHVRLQKPNSPSGYNRGDVKRLRARLELDPETPFIVGHTPLSIDDTLWLNAGGIPHHHVLFGANPDWVGVITQVGKRLLPLRYPAEPLLQVFNRLHQDARALTAGTKSSR